MMRLYNTLSKSIEDFHPIHPPTVGMYACGMTVYDYAHIGHGRKYVGDDILRRILEYLGHHVTVVQNVTDVGHLSSDEDVGEDKLEKGAAKYGKTVWDIAKFFTDNFYGSMDRLHIIRPTTVCKATDHISEQIALVETLIAKGFAYDTPEAVYFNVSAFPNYWQLFGQNLESKKTAVRDDVETGSYKRNATDFVLWFKCVGKFSNHVMHWESPWGTGFPGWHIECSAMSMKYLGEQFDIHTGGIDHVAIHHPNEIAQSECATGKHPFVKYWVHHAFLMVDGKKMSKSLGNLYTVDDVVEKGFDPLALRYLYLTSHYRKPLNFTWESLDGSSRSLHELRGLYRALEGLSGDISSHPMRSAFIKAIENDMNMPQALSVVWDTVRSKENGGIKRMLLDDYDKILGLGLAEGGAEESEKIPQEVTDLVKEREAFRTQHEFSQADNIRRKIEDLGFCIEDSNGKTIIKRK